MPFELYIALRYLLAKRKQAFISLISVISALGVAVGVMATIIALALMTGLQGELRDRILGSSAHVYVHKPGESGIADYHAEATRMKAFPGVLGAAPAIVGKALVTGAGNSAFITIKGIDPAYERTVTQIDAAMRSGSLDALSIVSETDPAPGIIIGVDLAKNVGASVGESVTLLTPEGTTTPFGVAPRSRRVRVVGVFSLGLFEFDSAYGFVSLPLAARMLNVERPEFMQLRVADIYDAPAIAERLTDHLGGDYLAQDWADLNKSLFGALWIEKMAVSITIGLIMMVAALNIIASLVLLVMEKNRDIAILKTMGTSRRSIMTIFMLEGLIIGVMGTMVGAAGGYLISTVLDRYKLIRVPIDVYQIAHIPFIIEMSDLVTVVAAAMVICFLATLYPSRQASRLDPAQALRYQ